MVPLVREMMVPNGSQKMKVPHGSQKWLMMVWKVIVRKKPEAILLRAKLMIRDVLNGASLSCGSFRRNRGRC